MARVNALTGAQIAKFKNVELHTQLQMITDSRGPRTIVHEFPYSDGGKIEVLGRRPHRTEWQLTFTGPTWVEDFKTLVATIDDNPAGQLIHPIYGQMQVVCEGFDRAVVDILQATDTVSFSLRFTEDQQGLAVTLQQSAATRTQDVTSGVENFMALAAPYISAASQAQLYVNAASGFASAAFASASSAALDPSLATLLDSVGSNAALVETAILADPLGGDALAYDVLAATEVVYAACLDLADEVSLETAGFEQFVTVGLTSIAVVCGNKYGSLALSKIDQVLRLNPQIGDPTAIPPGTTIILPL